MFVFVCFVSAFSAYTFVILQDGVNWLSFLNKYKLHGILCDDMGLGKTLQSICILAGDHYLRYWLQTGQLLLFSDLKLQHQHSDHILDIQTIIPLVTCMTEI